MIDVVLSKVTVINLQQWQKSHQKAYHFNKVAMQNISTQTWYKMKRGPLNPL